MLKKQQSWQFRRQVWWLIINQNAFWFFKIVSFQNKLNFDISLWEVGYVIYILTLIPSTKCLRYAPDSVAGLQNIVYGGLDHPACIG